MKELPTVEIYGNDFSLVIEPQSEEPTANAVAIPVAERVKLTPQQWAALLIAIIQAIAAALGAVPTVKTAAKGGQHETPPTST